MAAKITRGRWYVVACPWCFAAVGRPCRRRAAAWLQPKGRSHRPHEARRILVDERKSVITWAGI